MTLKVNEIFCSIQGESSWSGLPCTFIRLTGCNLRCTYCDTQYAYEEGQDWSSQALAERLAELKWERVCLTGGEPLLQDSTPAFIANLLDQGYKVSIETNGSLDISLLDRRSVKVVDIKCPSSGMAAYNRMENLNHMGSYDQIKFVIANKEDFQFACEVLPQVQKKVADDRILFSPVDGSLPTKQLAKWILDGHINVRFQIQLHKRLWPDQERGF